MLLVFSVNRYRIFLWKRKKVLQLTMFFKKIFKESNCKPDKIWVDEGRKFYNRSTKSWLEKNATEIYSKHNEGKSVAAERFIKTLKNSVYKKFYFD